MNGMHLAAPDLVVVLGYFVLVLLIGMYFRRQQKTAEDYFAGGHQVSWWLAGISHYMSGFSAFTFVVYSEIAYRYGLVAIILFWTSVPACILGGALFAKRWRRARIITPVEFLEQRCSLTVRQTFAWAAIPAKIFEDSLKIFTTALFLSAGMGLGIGMSILLCTLIVIAYTVLGGLLALVVTDYLQFIMKALAILLLLPLAVWRLGGLAASFHSVPRDLLHAHAGPYSWVYILSYLLIVCISYNGSWSFAQKYYSVPDERSGQRAAYLAAALNFVGTPILLLPAMMARSLMPQFSATHKPQDVYVQLIFTLLPPGMIGIIIAALFSATMATVSADLNAIAGVLTKDVYQRILRPHTSERALVTVGRTLTFVLGSLLLSLSLWLAHSHQDSLFHVMVTAFGVLLSPTLLPMLATLLFPKLTSRGVLAGFTTGLASGILTLCAKTWLMSHSAGPTQALDYQLEGISIFINVAATCAGMWAGSRWLNITPDEQARTNAFFARLQRPITAAESHVSERQSEGTSHILRLSTASVGALLVAAGLLSHSPQARWVDGILGSLLLLSAIPLRQLRQRRS
ncbi:transporter, SSS family [Bryocella elongata]|uniref:Transporter, SSS family n=1 Tax=Bryocella elongata TaxID=863522 RepID=A0A1H6C2M2_9BACT|nr:hypothetical protein [Bryocella elongata]SEG67224.1 transporter, SSS family [Bryocella elongata]